jgi:NADPH2:quinone reductase
VRAIDAPRPGSGQVLLRVDAASLNYPDLLMTRGQYQMKPPLPFTLGGDMAGEVLEVGDGVESLAVGQRVWGVGLGCFAEQAVLPEASVAPLPASLDAISGAAFGAAYLTAYVALVERARVQPGEWVLVHGAAGGMGLAAVDLAKALGAKVICTSTSDEKLARIAELYAPDAVVNLRDGFRERVLELTGGGADVIFDPVNGDVFDESIRSIAFDGRLLVIGFTSGEHRSLRSNIAMIKAFSLMGVRAGEYGRRFPDRRKRIGEALAALAVSGTIRPYVDAVYPLERWREAFARMERRDAVGKIVLSLDGKER